LLRPFISSARRARNPWRRYQILRSKIVSSFLYPALPTERIARPVDYCPLPADCMIAPGGDLQALYPDNAANNFG
jgi:hypothetical protein